MDVEVNLIGILLAAVSAMVVGSIWYSRGVFGETWAKLAKVNYEKQMQGNDWTPMVYMFILALVMAYVLAHVTGLSQAFFGKSYLSSAFNSAFWMWLGFMVPATFGNGLFESRRKKLMGLNAGNWLVTLLVMGAVIGYVGVQMYLGTTKNSSASLLPLVLIFLLLYRLPGFIGPTIGIWFKNSLVSK